MNRKMLCDVLSMIDEKYIEESIAYRSADTLSPSERKFEMNNKHSRKSVKKIIAVAIAACLMLSLVVTASTYDWSIRSSFEKSGRDLPEQAYEYIVLQSDSAQTEEWSCAVTETLCDNREIIVAIKVTCSEKYFLIPTDCSSDDPTGFIDVESDMTIGEYAAAQGKEVMNIGAGFSKEDFNTSGGTLSFERVSDNEMIILMQTTAESDISLEQGRCTVYARAPGVGKSQQELTFTMSKSPVISEMVYAPADPDAIDGVSFENAIVTETLLGVSITIEGTAVDWNEFLALDLRFKEISGLVGGVEKYDDGKWVYQRSQGQGELTDTLTLQVLDLETQEHICDVLFLRKDA